MSGDYQAMARAVRAPMRRWWIRTGVWLLFVQALGWLLLPVGFYAQLFFSGQAPSLQRIIQILRSLSFGGLLVAQIWTPIVWFLAAAQVERLVHALLDRTALPKRHRFKQHMFRLCVMQGAWPLLIALLGIINYTYLSIYASGAASRFSSSARVALLEGLIHLLFIWVAVALWAIGSLVYTRSVWLGLAWFAAIIAGPTLDVIFFIVPFGGLADGEYFGWYFAGALILVTLAVFAAFGLRALSAVALTLALALLVGQSWISSCLLFPPVFMRMDPLHQLLFEIDSIEDEGEVTWEDWTSIGPMWSYVNGTICEDSVFVYCRETRSATVAQGRLMLAFVVSLNLLLLIGHYYLILWALGRTRFVLRAVDSKPGT